MAATSAAAATLAAPRAGTEGALAAAARRARGATVRALGHTRIFTAPMSQLGWALTLSAIGCWLLGVLYGWVELLIAAVTGTVLLGLAVGFLVGRAPHTAVLAMSALRVAAGERCAGRIVVANPTRRRLLPSRVELRVGAGVADVHVPALSAGATHDEPFVVPTHRRGIIIVGPLCSVRGDPLGLLRREHTWTDSHTLYVHPRTLPLRGSAAGFIKDLEGRTTRELSNHDVSFHALREYAPGDDRRYIHWRTTARTGTLMVRQFEETRRSHLAVILSLSRDDYADGMKGDEEFELAVSVTGSLGVQALRDEHMLSVLATGKRSGRGTAHQMRRLRTTSRPRLLDELAGVEMFVGAAPLEALARATVATVSGISVAVMVCGSTVSRSAVRAAAMHFPSDARVVAVTCKPDGAQKVQVVGAVTTVTSTSLDALPRLVHQAAAL